MLFNFFLVCFLPHLWCSSGGLVVESCMGGKGSVRCLMVGDVCLTRTRDLGTWPLTDPTGSSL